MTNNEHAPDRNQAETAVAQIEAAEGSSGQFDDGVASAGLARKVSGLNALSLPGGMYRNSIPAKVLRAFHQKKIEEGPGNLLVLAEQIAEHHLKTKSVAKVADALDSLIEDGHLLVVPQNGSDLCRFAVSPELLVRREARKKPKKIAPLVFVVDEGLAIKVHSQDIRQMDPRELVLTRMLQMTTYGLSGISQEQSLGNFLGKVNPKYTEELVGIMDELTDNGMIVQNGDESKHLTPEGKKHILDHLGEIGSINGAEHSEIDIQEPSLKIPTLRDPIILGPRDSYDDDIMPTRPQWTEQNQRLSPDTLAVVKKMEAALRTGTLDKQDAELTLLSSANQRDATQLAKRLLKKTGWDMSASFDSTTGAEGLVYIVFFQKKRYDVEALTESRGMTAHDFSIEVLGDRLCVKYRTDLTVKHVFDLKDLSTRLDAMYRKGGGKGKYNPDYLHQHSANTIIPSATNHIVHAEMGRLAYYPEWPDTTRPPAPESYE